MLKPSHKILNDISIPSRPEILVKISNECAKDTPNLTLITDLITQDISLSGSILKTINSPLYGLPNKIDSIQHAVSLLGLNSILTQVRSAALRGTFKYPVELSAILDDAHDIAMISSAIANQLGCVETDTAYSVGLFHASGIPVMMSHFADYQAFYKSAQTQPKLLTTLENEHYRLNFAKVSGAICREWLLSSSVIIAVENHYRLFEELFSKFPNEQQKLSIIAILKMAITINFAINKIHRPGSSIEIDWQINQNSILSFLGITENEYSGILEFVFSNLNNLR